MPRLASERTALVCASATTFLGGLGLLGWVTPWRGLARIDPASVPMAPSTALALLLLGGTLMLEAGGRAQRLATALSLLVSVFACVQLVTFLAGLPPTLDALLVPAADMFGSVPAGKMSPWAALALLLSSLSLLFIGRAHRHPALGSAGGGLAVVVCLLGVVVTLGYIFGAPFLYGSSVAPVAFPTGLAMVCLGLTLIGLTPRNSALLRPFTGSSARAKLLRALLPVAPASVAVGALLDQIEGLNPALDAALTSLLSAFVVAAVVSYVAHGVGQALERAQAEQRRSEARYRRFFEEDVAGVLLTAPDGRVLECNPALARIFGFASPDEARGCNALSLYPDPAHELRRSMLERLHADGKISDEEIELRRRDGSIVHVIQNVVGSFGAAGELTEITSYVFDITERKRAEERLREYERVVEGLDEMIIVVDRDYRFLLVNRAYLTYRRMAREEILGRRVPELLGKEVFERVVKKKLDECFEGKVVKYEMSYSYPELGERDFCVSYFPIEGPTGVDRVACVLEDITDRRRAEEQQEHLSEALQALTRRLVSAHETERREIARELHDEAGQLLTGLKLLIESADLDAGRETSAASQLKRDLTFTLDELFAAIRDISTQLRPPMLDDLGLVPTLTWHVQRFTAITGVRVRLDCDPSNKRRFGADVEIAAYRLVQESLTNVARHAMTDTAGVELRTDGTKLLVRVSDSGRGFSPSEKIHGSSLGLLGMRERCLALGGQLSIDSSPGAGTTVVAELPLEPSTSEAGP
jgi:PAS domain S-box-containing protein